MPTEAWLRSVKAELPPLNTINRLLRHLSPQLAEISRNGEQGVDEAKVLEFLRSTSMVGLLPVPHPNKYTVCGSRRSSGASSSSCTTRPRRASTARTSSSLSCRHPLREDVGVIVLDSYQYTEEMFWRYDNLIVVFFRICFDFRVELQNSVWIPLIFDTDVGSANLRSL